MVHVQRGCIFLAVLHLGAATVWRTCSRASPSIDRVKGAPRRRRRRRRARRRRKQPRLWGVAAQGAVLAAIFLVIVISFLSTCARARAVETLERECLVLGAMPFAPYKAIGNGVAGAPAQGKRFSSTVIPATQAEQHSPLTTAQQRTTPQTLHVKAFASENTICRAARSARPLERPARHARA